MKIIAEFDTKTKKASVRIDGQKVENLSSLEMFIFDASEGEGFITLHSIDTSKSEDGVMTITRIEASEAGPIYHQKYTSKDSNDMIEKLARALFPKK